MIRPVGMNPGSTTPIAKTAPVGPRIQPEEKPEKGALQALDELRAQKDVIQNQLTTLKDVVKEAKDQEQMKTLENKLEQVKDTLSAAEPEKPTALERLKGQQDLYENAPKEAAAPKPQEPPQEVEAPKPQEQPEKATLNINTDKVDQELKGLQKKQQDISQKADAAGKRGDEEAWNRLVKELKSVQTELQQKDNDTYRRQNSDVAIPGIR